MRLAPALLVPAVVVCTLVSCSSDDGQAEAASTTRAERPPKASSPSSTPPSPSGSPGEENPGKALPRPAPGTCQPVAETPDGRYDLGELGEVTLRVDDPGALTFDVRSGGGWSTSVNSTPGQASVRFTRGEDEVELEGEIEGDRGTIQICDDA